MYVHVCVWGSQSIDLWVAPVDWHFKMIFSRDIYSPIVETMLAAKGPTYNTILDLDRRIRQMTLPPIKLYLRPDDDDYNNPALCMKSYLMSHYRSLSKSYECFRVLGKLITRSISYDPHTQNILCPGPT